MIFKNNYIGEKYYYMQWESVGTIVSGYARVQGEKDVVCFFEQVSIVQDILCPDQFTILIPYTNIWMVSKYIYFFAQLLKRFRFYPFPI